MAAMCACLCRSVARVRHSQLGLSGFNNQISVAVNDAAIGAPVLFAKTSVKPDLLIVRESHSFFSRTTAEQLWKGVTSVSSAGKKKGRGKRMGRKIAIDLNRGQVIGFGKKNMVWPGLNAPVLRGREVISQRELPPDESREKRVQEMRDRMSAFRVFRVHPLERGWSGIKLPGRSIGPPDPVGDETFEGFDSRVLQFKSIAKMTGLKGRVRRLSAFVVVGNKNGLAGFALSKSTNGNTAANNAKNKAAKLLRYIERYNDHTVLHDFHASFGGLNVFVKKKQEGFGLVCHRALRAICEMIGIKDIYIKAEGNTKNTQNLTKAFFIGLMRQKTFQQLAEEKGMHVVEMRKERDYFPEVVASPPKCRSEEEISVDEITDFNLYLHGGKVQEEVKPYEPFFKNHPGHLKRQKELERLRNQRDVKIQLLARYDGLKSFLTVREEEKARQAVKDAVSAES